MRLAAVFGGLLGLGLGAAAACAPGWHFDLRDRGDVYVQRPDVSIDGVGKVVSRGSAVQTARFYLDNPDAVGKSLHWHVAMDGGTDRYAHGIMGDLRDSVGLIVYFQYAGSDTISCPLRTYLPADQVIEDIAPRWADVTGDGVPEIVTVVSSTGAGARLAIFDRDLNPVAMGPAIGRRNRWLAVAGVGDFNGDGQPDIAYVETPHLGKTLRIWTLRDGDLLEIGRKSGLTNHAIGEETIQSTVRRCDSQDQIVVQNADRGRWIANWIEGGAMQSRDLGPVRGKTPTQQQLNC